MRKMIKSVVRSMQAKGTRAKKTKAERLEKQKTLLFGAVDDVLQLWIDTVKDPEAAMSQRLDCANKIMERVYGKAGQPMDAESDQAIRILLDEKLSELAT